VSSEQLSRGSVTKNLAIGTLLILALTAVSKSGARNVDLGLPPALAGYREWTQLINVPYEVPLELWVRCVAPTPKDWETARAKYGPHTERFIQVYGNAASSRSLAENKRPFPIGTVIAKEKLSGFPHGSPDGVAFMVKREAARFPDSGGWEFLYFPSDGEPRATHKACASCHKAARSRDYLFGGYPK
jgi:hypothetical protein